MWESDFNVINNRRVLRCSIKGIAPVKQVALTTCTFKESHPTSSSIACARRCRCDIPLPSSQLTLLLPRDQHLIRGGNNCPLSLACAAVNVIKPHDVIF